MDPLLSHGRTCCGACGRALTTEPGAIYVCKTCERVNVPADPLHQDIAERTLARLLLPESKERIVRAAGVGVAALPSLTPEGLVGWWESAGTDQRKGVVGTLVERVMVHPGETGAYDTEQTQVVWR